MSSWRKRRKHCSRRRKPTLKAWEDLLAARQAVAAKEHPAAIRYAKRASELAQLGLEQLAYPAVK